MRNIFKIYYPFGMLQPDMYAENEDPRTRFGFNGMLRDDDIKDKFSTSPDDEGRGNSYATHFRMYDPRVARWFSIDPKPNPSMSPYTGFNNNPVMFTDPKGDTIKVNKYGGVVSNDKQDNLVYMQNGDNIKHLGELGKEVNSNEIFENLLNKNMVESAIIYPWQVYQKVKNKRDWDLKAHADNIFGLANIMANEGKISQTQFIFKGENLEAQDIGNFHFGAIAKSSQAIRLLGEDFILKQAGLYQIKSGTSKPEWQKYETINRKVTNFKLGESFEVQIRGKMLPPYGDDPRDQHWIIKGFRYYDKKSK